MPDPQERRKTTSMVPVYRQLLRDWVAMHRDVYRAGAWEYNKTGAALIEATDALLARTEEEGEHV